MGATIEDCLTKKVSHVFAADLNSLLQKVNRERLARFKGVSSFSMLRFTGFSFSFLLRVAGLR